MAEIVTVILLLTGVIEKTYIRPEGDVFIGVISTYVASLILPPTICTNLELQAHPSSPSSLCNSGLLMSLKPA
jgi:hypothetical protein